jgi:murein DD-endopeptidase MepM/ murein hydrolase activator NlpD
VTGGKDGAASVVFERVDAVDAATSTILVQTTPTDVTVSSGPIVAPAQASRVLEASVEDLSDPQSPIAAMIPAAVRWELETLVSQMASPPVGERSAIQPAGEMVRVGIGTREGQESDYLQSIEIIDDAGRRVDGAWWLERADGPGVLIGMKGDSSERLLWQSPVVYRRMSRGVGQVVTTVRARIAPAKNATQVKSAANAKNTPVGKTTTVANKTTATKPPMRTVQIRTFHGGEDLAAPTGSEVHAVGNAKVSFAGRRGGFGKLVILDHGLGYQTYYAHLSAIDASVVAGAVVNRGEIIGRVGSTGHSTGPHLHFETRKDGKYIDSFDDARALEFWQLTEQDQAQLAMEVLTSMPTAEMRAAAIQELNRPEAGVFQALLPFGNQEK